jgi:hypothetical protein
MEEKDLIAKLSLLKDVKPRNEWVLFAKTQILADSKPIAVNEATYVRSKASNISNILSIISVLRYLGKPAYVLPILLVFVFGGVTLQVSKNSLPGDALFSVRSAFEKATLSNLELAQKRLEDLKKIAQENKVKNLSETIKEFKASVGEVSKNVAGLVDKEPSNALQAGRELVQLQKDKAAIEQILGTALDGETEKELKNATKYLVENELEDLLTRTLTDDQKQLLEQGIIAYQVEDYELALEKIWEISNAAD